MNDCIYCGAYADSIDHIVSCSYTGHASRKRKSGKVDNGYERVPACRECNNFLYNFLIFDIEERREYVQQRLKERYGSYVHWTEEELAELGPTLRSAVITGNRKVVK